MINFLARVDGGVAVEAAHAVKDIHHLAHAGRAGLVANRAAQLRQGLLVVVAELAVPVHHHQGADNAARPFARLLHGLEMRQDGQRVGRGHVVEVETAEVRAVHMVARAFNAVRAVFRAEIHRVGNLHLVGVVAVRFVRQRRDAQEHRQRQEQGKELFHGVRPPKKYFVAGWLGKMGTKKGDVCTAHTTPKASFQKAFGDKDRLSESAAIPCGTASSKDLLLLLLLTISQVAARRDAQGKPGETEL